MRAPTWEDLAPHERDALVAEHVMGVPSAYSTDPSADYEVLRRVRETWDKHAKWSFREALWRIWTDREDIAHTAVLLYQPGDYSIAALKALGVIQ